jgi:hypothetical protein
LLVLVDPLERISTVSSILRYCPAYLVKVGLQEVHLLVLLEQTGPEFLLELLLAQYQRDVATAVADLRLLGVDLGE